MRRIVPCLILIMPVLALPALGAPPALSSADQVAAFTANGGFAPGAVSTVVLGFVFAVLLLTDPVEAVHELLVRTPMAP